jgi:hypothetical protein
MRVGWRSKRIKSALSNARAFGNIEVAKRCSGSRTHSHRCYFGDVQILGWGRKGLPHPDYIRRGPRSCWLYNRGRAGGPKRCSQNTCGKIPSFRTLFEWYYGPGCERTVGHSRAGPRGQGTEAGTALARIFGHFSPTITRRVYETIKSRLRGNISCWVLERHIAADIRLGARRRQIRCSALPLR